MTVPADRPSRSPRVIVTVGTDHHRFDRLVRWVDEWAGEHPDVSVLIQRGDADEPVHADSVAMIGYDELVAAMATADVVVAQGGPAAIMDARSVGQRPVVIPRQASLGEHVDDHQVRFARWMADRDLVVLADSEQGLHALLDQATDDPAFLRIPPDGGAVSETIATFRTVVDPLLTARRR